MSMPSAGCYPELRLHIGHVCLYIGYACLDHGLILLTDAHPPWSLLRCAPMILCCPLAMRILPLNLAQQGLVFCVRIARSNHPPTHPPK